MILSFKVMDVECDVALCCLFLLSSRWCICIFELSGIMPPLVRKEAV